MKATLIARINNVPRPYYLIPQNNKGIQRFKDSKIQLFRVSPKDLEHQHRATSDEIRPTPAIKAESLEATSSGALRPGRISPFQGFPFMRIPYHRALPDAYDTRSSTLSKRYSIIRNSNKASPAKP